MNNSYISDKQSPVVPWQKIRQEIGISEATSQRWQKWGWVKTIRIGGRRFITHEELERFKTRLLTGEFTTASTKEKLTTDDSKSTEGIGVEDWRNCEK